jgi:hypothetical protein
MQGAGVFLSLHINLVFGAYETLFEIFNCGICAAAKFHFVHVEIIAATKPQTFEEVSKACATTKVKNQ